MPLTDNQIHYFISYAVAFLVFGLIAKWYLWPAIKDRAPKSALTPLLLYACLRVNGLMFMMPGLVSPELPHSPFKREPRQRFPGKIVQPDCIVATLVSLVPGARGIIGRDYNPKKPSSGTSGPQVLINAVVSMGRRNTQL